MIPIIPRAVEGAARTDGSRRERVEDAIAVAIAAAAAFVLCLAPVSDVDFFWHLAVGRYAATNGALPGKNLWSFTAPDHPFAATAWLFDWTAYQLQAALGIAGVQVAVALVLATTFGFVYFTARRRGARVGWALTFTLAAEAASQTRFSQRPHAVSYLCLAALGFAVATPRKGKGVWIAAPLLIALWSNFHAGAVFGTGLIGLVAISHWINRPRGRDHSAGGWSLCAAACVVALVANPSGLDEVSYALFHLRSVTTVVELSEFGSPTLANHAMFWILFGLAPLALVLRGKSARTDADPADQWLPVLAVAAFGLLAVRAMYVAPMFSIVTVPFTAAIFSLLGNRNSSTPRLPRPSAARVLNAGVVVLGPPLALVGGLALAPEPLTHFVSRVSLGTDPFSVPAPAAQWAKANGIEGRCFPSWDASGFVEWALPGSPVYADPRLLAYPPKVFTELATAEETQESFDALMDRHGVEWAFRTHRVLRMSGLGRFPRDRWALVYWDESSLLFLRRGVPKFEALIAQHEIQQFLPAASPFDSWRTLEGDARTAWLAEVRAAAARSPLLASAQLGLCLEEAKAGALGDATRACDLAVAAVAARERFHPLEGQVRRVEVALALSLLGRAFQRAGDAKAFAGAIHGAELLGRGSPEVLTAVGGIYLESDPARALRYFDKALEVKPDFAPALKGRAAVSRRP